ncbi:MAG: class I SAM-dependent methyltransferase [Alphaproteobacteria bacterium]
MTESPCRRRADCRLCGGTGLDLVLKLEPTPPANAFVGRDALGIEQQRFPLDVFLCRACGHVQLRDVVDPALLFENYVYVSGTSPVFVRHFEDYAGDILGRYPLPSGAPVVDIGSNDGTLLRIFQDRGCRVLGVDPAREIAYQASVSGIDTLPRFFSAALARETIVEQRGYAVLVTANNVFAHADDLADIVEGVRILLTPGGLFVFEVSYLVDVFEKTLFDTIYHEHVAYHTVKPLVRFLDAHGLELIEAIRVDSHGGSLRGVAQVKGGPWPVRPSVAEAVANEERLGLDRPETFAAFAARIDSRKAELGGLLAGIKASGGTIAGFGAPAKATTLLYHFGIGPDVIDFIVDDSPLKQGLHSPGMHIPVLPSQAIYDRRPSHVVVLAWNFADPIMARHAAYRDGGGHFIVPLPDVKVY